jgi:hypothetical protein
MGLELIEADTRAFLYTDMPRFFVDIEPNNRQDRYEC